MRILILDDDPKRHIGLAQQYIGCDLVHCKKYVDAQREALIGGFDLYHLDHDLGFLEGDNYVDDGFRVRELTGADFAQFIVKEVPREKWPPRIIIHSWNPAGARNMQAIFKDAGVNHVYQPYTPIPSYTLEEEGVGV